MLTRNLVILAGGEVLTRGLTFIAFVHLARVFEPAIYGLVELTLAVLTLLSLVIDQGLGTFGTREVARYPDKAGVLVCRIVSTQMILATMVYALLAVSILCLPIGTTLTLLLLGYGVSLLGIPFFMSWVFQGRKQMMWVALPQVLRWATFAALVLLVVRAPEQVLRLPLAELTAVAIAVIVNVALYMRSGDRIALDLRTGLDGRLLAESLPIGGSQLIWALRMYLPTILLGLLAGQAAVGLFAAAHRIVMVFQALLNVYFVNLFPTMSQDSYSSTERLANLLHRSLRLVVWPSLALALATALAAPMIIGLVFGDQYMQHETISVLGVLIWMIPILAWRRHSYSALITMNRQREEFVCSLIGVALLSGLVVLLTSTHGVVGVAWAMVVSEFVAAALIWWRLKRHLPSLSLVQKLSFPYFRILTGLAAHNRGTRATRDKR